MSRKKPTAKVIQDIPGCRTVWRISWPSVPMVKKGKEYIAHTYPGSETIYLETAAKRRPVSELVGRKIYPAIRDAIAQARTTE